MCQAVRSGGKIGAIVIVVWVMLCGLPETALAHTEVDFTLPTDGAVVEAPVPEITIGFTEAVTVVGTGFRVLSPQGEVIEPIAETEDNIVFRLQLDPPLTGGQAGVSYEVTSDDGHVVSGAFSFTIGAPLQVSTAPAVSEATSTTVPSNPAPTDLVAVDTTVTVPDSTPTSLATLTETLVATSNDPVSSESGGSNVLAYLIGAVAIAAVGLLVVRSRSSGQT